MWLEVKIFLSLIGWICITIVMSLIIIENIFLGFLLIIAIGLSIFGNMLIGYQIKHNHVDKLIDPLPQNKELGILVTITGLMDFIWSDKKPQGKREFVYHKQEAAYINNGDYPIHMINGNHGCLIHESHDEEISLFEAKAAEKIKEEYDTTDIKKIYAIEKEKNKDA